MDGTLPVMMDVGPGVSDPVELRRLNFQACGPCAAYNNRACKQTADFYFKNVNKELTFFKTIKKKVAFFSKERKHSARFFQKCKQTADFSPNM